MIVDQSSAYNALIGRPLLKEMKVITSIYHLYMKFPTPTGVGCIKGCQYESRECYNRVVKGFEKSRNPKDNMMLDSIGEEGEKVVINMVYVVDAIEESKEENPNSQSVEDSFNENKGKMVISGLLPVIEIEELENTLMSREGASALTEVFMKNIDVDIDPRMPIAAPKAGPNEDKISIYIDDNDTSKVLKIGSCLKNDLMKKLTGFLKSNLDIFSWSHADIW